MSTRKETNTDLAPLRLLLIDDEPAILASFSLAFGDEGWEVTTSESGEDGVETHVPGKFDLVITDKNLPGMSGVEVVEQIRQRDAAVTIMMLTGFGSTSSAVDTLNAGVDAYEEKPVRDVIRLTARAAAIIKRRQKQLELEAATKRTPPNPFEVLILTTNKKNAKFISADLVGKVDKIAIAADLEQAQTALTERTFGLILAEEGLANLCDTIEAVKNHPHCAPIAVLGQHLGLDTIMRLVETGVAACIVLPIGSPPCAKRLTDLIKELREEHDVGLASARPSWTRTS